MKRSLVTLVAGLFLLALATPAHAGVCYDWSCDETTRVCNFDASCTNLGTTIMYWHWNFGDGTTYLSSTSPLATHAYDYRNWAHVTLTVHYWWDSSIGCDIIIWNTVGPAVPTWGQCN
jgi:PKD domain